MPITLDPLSFCAPTLRMFFGHTLLSTGTAFFWSNREGTVYLVTAWHCLSGKDPRTGRHLSETLCEPDRIEVDIFPGGDPNCPFKAQLGILDVDGKPLWRTHPKHGEKVDVACLPTTLRDPDVKPINFVAHCHELIKAVGVDAFILGYPLGPMQFPVFKRCSIATEPELNVYNLPCFLVDSVSSRGMSGAPVVVRANGLAMTANGVVKQYDGFPSDFIGIYTGRENAPVAHPEANAQLGIVWKASVVDEIIA
jgi:hypothetical protein